MASDNIKQFVSLYCYTNVTMNADNKACPSPDSSMKNMDELKSYRDELVALFNQDGFAGVSNEDRAHNAMVTSVMLEHCSEIQMFCGEISIFRKGFYEHIKNNTDSETAEYAEHEMSRALKSFTSAQGKKMTVYIQNYTDRLRNDLIDGFEEGVRGGKIILYQVDKYRILKSCLNHIAMGDEGSMVRIESNRRSHNADCLFHMPNDLVKTTSGIFGRIKEASHKVDWC